MQREGRTDARARLTGSLRGRLLLAGLAVIAPLLIGAGLWIALLSNTSKSYRELASEASMESGLNVALLERLNEAEEAGIHYIDTGSATARAEFERLSREVDRELSDTRRYDASPGVVAFASIRRPWGLAKAHIAGEHAHEADQDTFEDHMHQAATGLERLMAGAQDEVLTELAATERAARLNWLLGLAAVVVALLLAALLARRLTKSLVRPLEQLTEAARALGGRPGPQGRDQLDRRAQRRGEHLQRDGGGAPGPAR